MGIKVEKHFNRQELADFLADLSAQVRSGQLQGETRAWTVPEQVKTTIHLKEADGEVVTKIKLRWAAGEGHQTVQREAGEPLSFKAVKAKLSGSFKELQRVIRGGIMPDPRTVQDFAENSRLFANLAKPEWQGQMAEYLAQVEKLEQAAERGQLEAAQPELQVLMERMTACHREFKK